MYFGELINIIKIKWAWLVNGEIFMIIGGVMVGYVKWKIKEAHKDSGLGVIDYSSLPRRCMETN